MAIDPFGAVQEFRLSTGKSSRLLGMGVLPLQFKGDDSVESLAIVGNEVFDSRGLEGELRPRQDLVLAIRRPDGMQREVRLQLRVDTPVDYLRHGGNLPYVLRELLAEPTTGASGS
jgi:aconitate hydratase A / 2-methylisocitrate dehydratase